MSTKKATIQDRPPNFYDNGKLYLVRCFSCSEESGRENWAGAVASGKCAWCGWSEGNQCDQCGQAFDVSLPDTEIHSYECEECEDTICFDCKNMDDSGIDFCRDCVEAMNK